ncbi:MAG: thiolase family protein [Deltaproteobacteria bacterium]|nr:thiolase family protein [Deltaproteobacteria bacterium]
MQDAVILSSARTPIGSFQGTLATLKAPQLGTVAIKAALERAGVKPGDVEEVYMGQVLTAGVGQAPARQAALGAGLPNTVPCTTLNKVCGSGLKSVMLAAQAIRAGDGHVFVAGGQESMSNAPYLLPTARSGMRMGNATAVDSMILDGLWDPYKDTHMGNCGDLCAKEKDLSRDAQDAFATESYKRAQKAWKDGAFKTEIAAVTIPGKKGDTVIDTDEEPSKVDFEKLKTLRPAFGKDGSVTAANASKLNDGASALVVTSREWADKNGRKPLAKILSYATAAGAPEWFTTAPIPAMQSALKKAGLSVKDIDLWEINEAFSVVTMIAMREMGLDHAKVNMNGGAVALGHPIGASGARIMTTLLHALQARNLKRGLASLCIGGGEAVAVIVERT